MLQQPNCYTAGHVDAAAAKGQTADNPCPVSMRIFFGTGLHHPIDCKPAQALNGNANEPKQCRGVDPAIRHGQISRELRGNLCHGRIAHAPTQKHVSRQNYERGQDPQFQKMMNARPIKCFVHSNPSAFFNSPALCISRSRISPRIKTSAWPKDSVP